MEESVPLLTCSVSKVVDAADVVSKSSRNAESTRAMQPCSCILRFWQGVVEIMLRIMTIVRIVLLVVKVSFVLIAMCDHSYH